MSAAPSLPLYFGGKWNRSGSAEYSKVIDPATAELLAHVPVCSAEDVDAAVRSAAVAFPGWRRTPPEDRVQYLFKLKQLLEDHLEALAQIRTQENGRTVGYSPTAL